MPPPTNPTPWLRTFALRPRRTARVAFPIHNASLRHNSSTNNPDALTKAPKADQKGPNMQQQEHVSEEAAQMAKIQGKEGPDMDAGTPVQEIMAEEKDVKKNAPKVVKEEMKQGHEGVEARTETAVSGGVGSGQKRGFSTIARRRMPELDAGGQGQLDVSMIPSKAQRAVYTQDALSTEESKPGHKFPLPTTTPTHKNERLEPILTQLTNLIMRDGKKSLAEKHVAALLSTLRTLPAPKYSETRPLLPGAPPASHLPLNPVLYLTLAVDSVAPLLKIRSQRGAAGGGVALQIPVPLGLRQRRRAAMTWILDAAGKKGTREGFAQRLAGEVVAVVEGRSGVWEKRQAAHRLGVVGRSNVMGVGRGRR
ncbi:hypothetical protein LTR09_004848 [Extremus antarcticus]|uniref:Small ribosomal subunit protein uS7 domain-containing protein n=1 Tax=Extremus antarcticus TaxID=702011 RepID=A0AAJ0GCN7_9PEZI|nr:hypothetical protein LTR09_004848 [Extremus antarcticus]